MDKGKRIGNEHFNILVLSQTDARKKPVVFSFSKKRLLGMLAAAVFFIAGLAGAFAYLLIKSSADNERLAALGEKQEEQAALLESCTKELQVLREKAAQTVMAEAPNPPSPSPAQPESREVPAATASPVREEPAAETQKPPAYKGQLGDSFTIEAVSLSQKETKKKAKWTSSNLKVAKVSGEGEVTLTGPGTATISRYGAGGDDAIKVTCVSQFTGVHYCQSDSRWGFPSATERKACVITSFAILLQNAGIHATPRTVYNANHSLSLRFPRLKGAFPVKFVNALPEGSPYLQHFDGNVTTIREPSKNYVAAVKEALDRNPEGVCLYFRRGSAGHMMVAVGYAGSDIYYTDPGRVKSKGHLVKFQNTWTYHKHRMTYKDVRYLVAIDTIKKGYLKVKN